MVAYIRSDLDFILAQIKIAEAACRRVRRCSGQAARSRPTTFAGPADGRWQLQPPAARPGAVGRRRQSSSRTDWTRSTGRRTARRSIPTVPGRLPAMPTAPNYNPSNNPDSLVFDSSLRTISNLLVDQTLGNPAAILTALQRAGSANADGRSCRSQWSSTRPSSRLRTPSIRRAL